VYLHGLIVRSWYVLWGRNSCQGQHSTSLIRDAAEQPSLTTFRVSLSTQETWSIILSHVLATEPATSVTLEKLSTLTETSLCLRKLEIDRAKMRLPQRFKRVPNEEPLGDQGILLPAYPPENKTDVKSETKVGFADHSRAVHTDTEYSAATYNSANYVVSHRKTLIEKVEEEEQRRFGTRLFGRFYDTFVGGWRAGLLRAFLLSLVALIVNIAVYAWLFRTYDAITGTSTIQRGHCGTIRGANTGIHAALNVVSTLILGASTYAMQGMTAPTRQEVDIAHAKGKWVEIGTQSLRNLFYVRKRNAWVWVLLGTTSLPFHLL
jgi:hypothetical protein